MISHSFARSAAIDTASPSTQAAISDQRLRPVQEGLASGRFKALSVDIFDTLVWRRVPEPADVFLLLGRALSAAGRLASHVSAVQFAELRKAAERGAREKAEAATG